VPHSSRVALEDFAAAWQDRCPAIIKLWRVHWQVHPVPGIPAQVRRVIYTTDEIVKPERGLRVVSGAASG
jgi:transposase-like protein